MIRVAFAVVLSLSGALAGASENSPVNVRRGQSVALVAQSGGIRLCAPGRALKEGTPGETIPVINLASRKPLQGVVREGWVEIVSDNGGTP